MDIPLFGVDLRVVLKSSIYCKALFETSKE